MARKYNELRMPLDDDDKLSIEVLYKGTTKITPQSGYLIGKITDLEDGMLVEFVKKQKMEGE